MTHHHVQNHNPKYNRFFYAKFIKKSEMSVETFEQVVSRMQLFAGIDYNIKEYKRAEFSGNDYQLTVASADIALIEDERIEVLAEDKGTHINILINGCSGVKACLTELQRCSKDEWSEDDLDMFKDALVDPENALEKWYLDKEIDEGDEDEGDEDEGDEGDEDEY